MTEKGGRETHGTTKTPAAVAAAREERAIPAAQEAGMMQLEICWNCWPKVAVAVIVAAAVLVMLLPARSKAVPA